MDNFKNQVDASVAVGRKSYLNAVSYPPEEQQPQLPPTTEKKINWGKILDVVDQVVDTLQVAIGRPTTPTTPALSTTPPKKPISGGVVAVVVGACAIVGTLVILKVYKKI
uniref:Uncharacterized protein n=1 Tax=viral metagenome TaxID=1070528 RepID=A0A6M3J524_9ZZZZ